MHQKWQSYGVWFLRYKVWWTEFFVILDCFLPFYPPNNPKNQNFEKTEKKSWDIIILHKCTKNHDHMLYCSLDIARNRCNYCFSFWTIFCPFCHYSPKNQNQKKKKMKKTPEDIIILHKCTKNYYHMLYCSSDMTRYRCNCYFSFCAIICSFTSITA